MKFQTLDHTELQEINGGADSATTTGAGLSMGTGSLVSMSYNYNDGQGKSYASQLDIGKDIRLDLGAFGNSLQS